jgi:hypothetical protein
MYFVQKLVRTLHLINLSLSQSSRENLQQPPSATDNVLSMLRPAQASAKEDYQRMRASM